MTQSRQVSFSDNLCDLPDGALTFLAINALRSLGCVTLGDAARYAEEKRRLSSVPCIGRITEIKIEKLFEQARGADPRDEFLDWCVQNREWLEKMRAVMPKAAKNR